MHWKIFPGGLFEKSRPTGRSKPPTPSNTLKYPNLTQNEILLCKQVIANKKYFIKKFDLLGKKLTLLGKFCKINFS